MNSQTRLFVGGIPTSASEDNLRKLFSKFGNVVLCDLKSKPSDPDNKFAFITINADQENVESCIHHFSQSDWLGSRLHVTRARESFLERLQKERQQSQVKKQPEAKTPPQEDYYGKLKIKTPGVNNFNTEGDVRPNGYHSAKKDNKSSHRSTKIEKETNKIQNESFGDEKKISSDKKRLESMKKMRQQFNEKKLIIKSGLSNVDQTSNKKIKFNDDTEEPTHGDIVDNAPQNSRVAKTLFDDSGDETGDDLDFQIKEQFEGKKGQKVLELQSRFKSDKRFTLDERFIEDEAEQQMDVEDEIQVPEEDEKARQLNILQNVLGVAIKSVHTQPQAIVDNKKTRTKMGMLRFDPSQPEHAKFLAPKESVQKETDTSTKRKKAKRKEEPLPEPEKVIDKVEVSKEQFYKVSDTLKEAIAQPNNFSLRSLFSKDQIQIEDEESKSQEQETGYSVLPAAKKDKVKNPFNTSTKNPFKYDSSDSEPEVDEKEKEEITPEQETMVNENLSKVVWKENLFFTKSDDRLKDGLVFFNSQGSGNKERRELKSLVKKRLYNRARKDTMFQKKIGGKRKNFGKHKQNR